MANDYYTDKRVVCVKKMETDVLKYVPLTRTTPSRRLPAGVVTIVAMWNSRSDEIHLVVRKAFLVFI